MILPKPKSRTKKVRAKKKRLVFELFTDGSTKTFLPSYSRSPQKWIGVISSEEGNEVDEFELKTAERLSLGEFLATIRGELPELIPHEATGCGIKVYVRA